MSGKDDRVLSKVSVVILVINVVILITLVLFIGIVLTGRFSEIFEMIGTSMPSTTGAFSFICIAVILILIIKEKLKNKIITLVVNILSFFFIIPALVTFYLSSVFSPINKITRQISDVDTTQSYMTVNKELSKEQIIWLAKSKAKELGFNPEEITVFYDEGNQKLKEYLKRTGAPVLDRETKEWKPAVGTTPEEEFPSLAGRNYQAVYFSPKVLMSGGDLWVFVDRNTGEVITYIMGE